MNTSNIEYLNSFQKLICQHRDLTYDASNRQEKPEYLEGKKTVHQYFAQQNKDYVAELDDWANLNSSNINASCFIFAVCRGELKRLPHLIKLYDEILLDSRNQGTLVLFLLNGSQAESENFEFEQQAKFLLTARKSREWMHLVLKRFPENSACLGRARKYGLDYCLRLSLSSSVDDPVIVSNEGDMTALNSDYVAKYMKAFRRTGAALIQGSVNYPAYCKKSKALSLFLDAREAVHHGQGRMTEDFPGFLGYLPVGRNFAVSSSVAAAANSIDSVHRKVTDDDMNFGADVFRVGGFSLKHYINNPIETSPRREIEIVASILAGNVNGTQAAYENFHGSFDLYRKGEEELSETLEIMKDFENYLPDYTMVLNSYYSWLFRSRMIEKVNRDQRSIIDKKYFHHEIGYWQRERAYFITYAKGFEVEKIAAHREAIYWLEVFLSEKGYTDLDYQRLSYVE